MDGVNGVDRFDGVDRVEGVDRVDVVEWVDSVDGVDGEMVGMMWKEGRRNVGQGGTMGTRDDGYEGKGAMRIVEKSASLFKMNPKKCLMPRQFFLLRQS